MVLTREQLFKTLLYRPIQGDFIWLNPSKYHSKLHGTIAGSLDAKGYVRVKIDGKPYLAHRLAWFYMTGAWPKKQLDHRNKVKNDNSWLNLREADDSDQNGNKDLRINNTSGFRGVYYMKRRNVWIAQLCTKPYKYLGSYQTKEEAAEKYKEAAKEYFGEFYSD